MSLANTVAIPKMNAYLQGYYLPRTDDGRPNRAAIDTHWPEVHTYMRLFSTAVSETGHLAGDRFTYADMNFLPVLWYLNQCPESSAALDGPGALRNYLDRHSERASLKATVPPPFPK